MCRLSKRLSLISDCLRLASPLTTLTKSYTTRRSQPMIRSRLRRPTSKSMTATLWPRRARPQAREALVVVLPTPPLPEVTTMISAKFKSSGNFGWSRGRGGVAAEQGTACPVSRSRCVQRGDMQLFVLQPDLHRFATQVLGDVLKHFVVAGDRD